MSKNSSGKPTDWASLLLLIVLCFVFKIPQLLLFGLLLPFKLARWFHL